jgi:hypothetical protein
MRTVRSFVLLAFLGGALMFVAHFGAFLAPLFVTVGLRLPYWWAYPILYPLAAALAARRGTLEPVASATAVCLLPATYFLALGLFESNWRASNTALLGVGFAFILAVGCSTWARRRYAHPPEAGAPAMNSHVRASLTAFLVGFGAVLLTFMAMMASSPLITFIFSALLYLVAGYWMGRSEARRVWFAPLVMSIPVWVVFVPMGMQIWPPAIRIWYFLAPPVLALLSAYAGMFLGARMSVADKTANPRP